MAELVRGCAGQRKPRTSSGMPALSICMNATERYTYARLPSTCRGQVAGRGKGHRVSVISMACKKNARQTFLHAIKVTLMQEQCTANANGRAASGAYERDGRAEPDRQHLPAVLAGRQPPEPPAVGRACTCSRQREFCHFDGHPLYVCEVFPLG